MIGTAFLVSIALLATAIVAAVINVKRNNFVWLGFGVLAIIIFSIALFNLGDPIARRILETQLSVSPMPPSHTWFWWELFFFVIVEWIFPLGIVCFWDEGRDALRAAHRALDSRRIVVKSPLIKEEEQAQPQAATVSQAAVTPSRGGFEGTLDSMAKWTERILPAELIAEFTAEFGPRLLRKLF